MQGLSPQEHAAATCSSRSDNEFIVPRRWSREPKCGGADVDCELFDIAPQERPQLAWYGRHLC